MLCAACGFHVASKLGLSQVLRGVAALLGGFGSLLLDGKKLIGAATCLSSPASSDGEPMPQTPLSYLSLP